jgi:hypothetical protein
MEGRLECDRGSWYATIKYHHSARWLTRISGPAHAVYFGTYEVVKELAGGNAEDGKHHPGAAGLLWLELQAVDIDAEFSSSSEWRMRDNSK